MMNVVIFANGELTTGAEAIDCSRAAELIIAVDGGGNHCQRLGIQPDIIVGDLDSIDPEALFEFEQKSISIHRYPADKDKTDLELAIDLAVEKGATQVTIFAALGGRWDMSLANLLLLAAPGYAGLELRLFAEATIIGVCHAGKAVTVTAPTGSTVSLIPVTGDAAGVSLTGFKYPLSNQTLSHTSTRGISNVLNQQTGKISVQKGALLWIATNS